VGLFDCLFAKIRFKLFLHLVADGEKFAGFAIIILVVEKVIQGFGDVLFFLDKGRKRSVVEAFLGNKDNLGFLYKGKG